MIPSKRTALAACTFLALVFPTVGSALALGGPDATLAAKPLVHTVQMQGLLELFADDGDEYAHDRHYDFDRYRSSTSRKERIRDYYRMQKDMEKDYWKSQKEMQKKAIKRQRGW